MPTAEFLRSIPQLVEVRGVGPSGVVAEADFEAQRFDVLFELPHGATTSEHFAHLQARLTGTFPDRLEDFFHVNTDVGSPEVAEVAAEALATAGLSVLLVRCLLPRTFVDTNRVADADAAAAPGGLNNAIQPYDEDPGDRALLADLHARYTQIAARAYDRVCGAGGTAVTLHTYAPRSIALDDLGGSIVDQLHRAYEPETLAGWPIRPPIDLITETYEGEFLAPPPLVASVERAYTETGFEVEQNASYRLFDATMGYQHSRRWPQQVLCLELRRDLLMERFDPFVPKLIEAQRAAALARPLAKALLNVSA